MSRRFAFSAAGFIATSTFGVSPGVDDVVIGDVHLERRHAGDRPGGRADLGREVGQGRQVVAEHGRQLREPVADELHAVARVAREPDHDLGRVSPLRRVEVASTVTVDHQLSQYLSRNGRRRAIGATPTRVHRPRASSLYRRGRRSLVLGRHFRRVRTRRGRLVGAVVTRRAPPAAPRPDGAARAIGAGRGPGRRPRPRSRPATRWRRPARKKRRRTAPSTTISSPVSSVLDPRGRVEHRDRHRHRPAVDPGRHLQLRQRAVGRQHPHARAGSNRRRGRRRR